MSNVVNLSDRQKDVFYTVRIQQGFDGHLAVFVEDVGEDERSRIAIAHALRQAADLFEDRTVEPCA